MPLVYIHGVNTRKSEIYYKNRSMRHELLRRYVLEPLAQSARRFEKIEIIEPYWGDCAATFRWQHESLPDVHWIQSLGGSGGNTPKADAAIAQALRQLVSENDDMTGSDPTYTEPGAIKLAATHDLTRLLDVLLSPILFDESDLWTGIPVTKEYEGYFEALLLMATDDVASDCSTIAEVKAAPSDVDVIRILGERIQDRFRSLVLQRAGESQSDRQSMGSEWLGPVQDTLQEIIESAIGAPRRALSAVGLDLWRKGLHGRLSRFMADVFVYLCTRGTREQPGQIVSAVLNEIRTSLEASGHSDDEPLIVVTHSMGGNILYDILTHFEPDLKVDFWASVGGQVGQFEEVKLFKASDRQVAAPDRVAGLKPPLGYWLNIYDPVDILSFRAEPIFRDVDADVPYRTNGDVFTAHSSYFQSTGIYKLLHSHLEQALQ